MHLNHILCFKTNNMVLFIFVFFNKVPCRLQSVTGFSVPRIHQKVNFWRPSTFCSFSTSVYCIHVSKSSPSEIQFKINLLLLIFLFFHLYLEFSLCLFCFIFISFLFLLHLIHNFYALSYALVFLYTFIPVMFLLPISGYDYNISVHIVC